MSVYRVSSFSHIKPNVARLTIQHVANNRERYIGEPPESVQEDKR